MRKRGSIELSFGMIFSIIVVIVIIATSFYVIKYFLGLQSCTQTGLFLTDLQDSVDQAWQSEFSRTTFTSTLPSGIEYVCLGEASKPGSGEAYEELRKYRLGDENLYLYPLEKACDLGRHTIKHVDLSGLTEFTCIEVQGGQANIRIVKERTNPLVELYAP